MLHEERGLAVRAKKRYAEEEMRLFGCFVAGILGGALEARFGPSIIPIFAVVVVAAVLIERRIR